MEQLDFQVSPVTTLRGRAPKMLASGERCQVWLETEAVICHITSTHLRWHYKL